MSAIIKCPLCYDPFKIEDKIIEELASTAWFISNKIKSERTRVWHGMKDAGIHDWDDDEYPSEWTHFLEVLQEVRCYKCIHNLYE